MQCNRNPIEFEFCWGVAVGEMGIRIPKPVCRKRCSVMSTKVESGRRETRGLCPVFPATKQRGSSRTTKQPARNGQAGDNYGHWPRDGQVWQLWPGTSKYGNYGQATGKNENEHVGQVCMGNPTWKRFDNQSQLSWISIDLVGFGHMI